MYWGFADQWNALFGKRWEVIPFKEAKGHLTCARDVGYVRMRDTPPCASRKGTEPS
jgi:hypothetical protein